MSFAVLMMRTRFFLASLSLCWLLTLSASCFGEIQISTCDIFDSAGNPRLGISYGPFRDGQQPGQDPAPTREEIREDLHIIAQHWGMLRVYGSDPFARTVCEIIRSDELDLKVMVGAWITTESQMGVNGIRQTLVVAQEANQNQIRNAIRIATAFKDIVVAVSVGNETQVSWSFHRVEPSCLIDHIKNVRRKISQPVSVADDFMYWVTPESKQVAAEIDFLVMHAYAMWHGRSLDAALAFTQEKYAEVKQNHPRRLVILGETGWATEKPTTGDQAERIAGVPGVQEQQRFYRELTQWTEQEKVPLFYFEAFDENWKGGADPLDVEKHWGLYRADRTPKAVIPARLSK